MIMINGKLKLIQQSKNNSLAKHNLTAINAKREINSKSTRDNLLFVPCSLHVNYDTMKVGKDAIDVKFTLKSTILFH